MLPALCYSEYVRMTEFQCPTCCERTVRPTCRARWRDSRFNYCSVACRLVALKAGFPPSPHLVAAVREGRIKVQVESKSD
jgi:hypothetical protein